MSTATGPPTPTATEPIPPTATQPTEPIRHEACLRCRKQKLRCIPGEGAACQRCARAGIQCQAAPPSRQGQRTDVISRAGKGRKLEAPIATVLDDVKVTKSDPDLELTEMAQEHFSRILAEWGTHNSCTEFLRGFFRSGPPTQDAVAWLLRHWALLATVRDCNALMTSTVSLAGACNVPVASLVLGLEKSMRAAELPSPDGVVHCVNSLPGFAFARNANPSSDGSIDLIVNAAFEEHVCAQKALKACWSANEAEMLSMFVHHEDVPILPRETGIFLSKVVTSLLASGTSPAPLVHPTQRVVRLLVDGRYIACHAKIKACAVEGAIYFGFFLQPLAAAPGQADASYTLLDLMHAGSLASHPDGLAAPAQQPPPQQQQQQQQQPPPPQQQQPHANGSSHSVSGHSASGSETDVIQPGGVFDSYPGGMGIPGHEMDPFLEISGDEITRLFDVQGW